MPRLLCSLTCLLVVLASPLVSQAKPAAHSSAKPAAGPKVPTDDAVRIQLFLDKENFGPGKIDGSYGGFTKLAWLHWQKAHGVAQPSDTFDPQSPQIAAMDPIYISYTIVPEDIASLGPLPSQLALQAKLKAMSYTELSELLGERFHVSVDFLKKLNAPKNIDKMKAGDTVTVPNVQPPFELTQVGGWRDLQRAQAAANKKNGVTGVSAPPPAAPSPAPSPVVVSSDTLAGDSATPTPAPSPSASPAASPNGGAKPSTVAMPALPVLSPAAYVHINVKECYLELIDNGKTIAAFPVTPGSSSIPTPLGEWKVVGKALFPEFRWDKEMLLHGKRSKDAYELPPGPNSPVGIAWMQLSKPGIGMHGTNNPETIGRAASHGCIRLANWDAFKLYNMVEKGMRVVIE